MDNELKFDTVESCCYIDTAGKQTSTGLASGKTKAQQAAPFISAAFVFSAVILLRSAYGGLCRPLERGERFPLYRYANLHSLPPYWRREIQLNKGASS